MINFQASSQPKHTIVKIYNIVVVSYLDQNGGVVVGLDGHGQPVFSRHDDALDHLQRVEVG